jgi:hypothetical protein
MTPQESLTRKRLLIRRSLVVLGTVLLATAWAVGISTPASAAQAKALEIVSITDQRSELGGSVLNLPAGDDIVGPVEDRPFDVVVRVVDNAGRPATVTEATTIVLEEVSGPGALEGMTSAVIPLNGSGATISGATYSQFANGVELRVRVESGMKLAPDEVSVEVAVRAVGRDAVTKTAVEVRDPECAEPTPDVPNCGQFLLPNGAQGHVTVSVGSCDELDGSGVVKCRDGALLVTAIANLKDEDGVPLYTKSSPATLVVACDKDLCRETANGVPKLPVFFTLNNTGPLEATADPCPKKGVIGQNQDACVDYPSSSRNQGDLYLHLLFVADARASM